MDKAQGTVLSQGIKRLEGQWGGVMSYKMALSLYLLVTQLKGTQK